MQIAWAVLGASLLLACGDGEGSTPRRADRSPGDRAPLTASCDDLDPTRCLLPWPSNTFTKQDPDSATGLRLAVDAASLPIQDDVLALNAADGFSTATAVVAGFDSEIDPLSLDGADGPSVRLLSAQLGSDEYGKDVALRLGVRLDGTGNVSDSLVVGFPQQVLAPSADYVVVVLDSLRTTQGDAPTASRASQVALGRRKPGTDAEERLRAYHAPTRSLLAEAGVDVAHVVRVWDFTTRSAQGPAQLLRGMREQTMEAVDSGTASVVIDAVTVGTAPIALVIEGRLKDLPSFVAEDGTPSLAEDGTPIGSRKRDAPFRIVVPEGSGDYPVAMYAHGNGGNFQDTTFDAEVASAGLAKVAIQLTGWHDTVSAGTLLGLRAMYSGSQKASSLLVQALADEAAIQKALGGALGELLAQPVLEGTTNPAAGRKPSTSKIFVTGGSLGGSAQAIHASADPAVAYGVLNVSGAGWTQQLLEGTTFKTLSPFLRTSYESEVDLMLALLHTQGIWDAADGAAWVPLREGTPPVFLVQESIGDPVAPNVVTERLALGIEAAQVRPLLVPIAGLEQVDEAKGRNGITQFKVSDTDALDIHGFAARNTPAGAAAREQIATFLDTALQGAPRIVVPSGCAATPKGDCDFSQ
ncbi:MAG: hypothetical protein R3B13_20245 [Polyangiaceae bacterium]